MSSDLPPWEKKRRLAKEAKKEAVQAYWNNPGDETLIAALIASGIRRKDVSVGSSEE